MTESMRADLEAVQKCKSAYGLCKGANVGGTYRVTGDSHQGIGLSGVSCSAFGSRLRVPAADGRKAEA